MTLDPGRLREPERRVAHRVEEEDAPEDRGDHHRDPELSLRGLVAPGEPPEQYPPEAPPNAMRRRVFSLMRSSQSVTAIALSTSIARKPTTPMKPHHSNRFQKLNRSTNDMQIDTAILLTWLGWTHGCSNMTRNVIIVMSET